MRDVDRFPFLPGAPVLLNIARTEGVHLITTDGRRVLDAAGGAIAVSIGHGRTEVAEAAASSLGRIDYVVPTFATDDRIELVERLVDRWLPPGIDRVFFTSGGSEAVDSAIRVARQYQRAVGRDSRWKVIGLDVSYHGTTLGTLAVGGHDRRRRGMEPLLPTFPKAPTHRSLDCPRSEHTLACAEEFAEALARVILEEGPDTVAAFIVEPVGGAATGAEVPPYEYLRLAKAVCRRYGVLMIVDEVMTGFGRTGRKFGVDHFDVVPDLLVGGKGLASGYAPIGMVAATGAVTRAIADAGDDIMFFTYGAHSACCAVASTVLDIVERESLVERAAKLGSVLGDALHARFDTHPNVAEVRGLGLLWGVEVSRPDGTSFPQANRTAMRVAIECVERGVFVYPAGSGRPDAAMLIGPPFTISEDDIEVIVNTLADAIDAVV